MSTSHLIREVKSVSNISSVLPIRSCFFYAQVPIGTLSVCFNSASYIENEGSFWKDKYDEAPFLERVKASLTVLSTELLAYSLGIAITPVTLCLLPVSLLLDAVRVTLKLGVEDTSSQEEMTRFIEHTKSLSFAVLVLAVSLLAFIVFCDPGYTLGDCILAGLAYSAVSWTKLYPLMKKSLLQKSESDEMDSLLLNFAIKYPPHGHLFREFLLREMFQDELRKGNPLVEGICSSLNKSELNQFYEKILPYYPPQGESLFYSVWQVFCEMHPKICLISDETNPLMSSKINSEYPDKMENLYRFLGEPLCINFSLFFRGKNNPLDLTEKFLDAAEGLIGWFIKERQNKKIPELAKFFNKVPKYDSDQLQRNTSTDQKVFRDAQLLFHPDKQEPDRQELANKELCDKITRFLNGIPDDQRWISTLFFQALYEVLQEEIHASLRSNPVEIQEKVVLGEMD